MAQATTRSASDFLKKSLTVARHYGFVPLDSLPLTEEGETRRAEQVQSVIPEALAQDSFGHLASKLLELCAERGMLGLRQNEPLLVYHLLRGDNDSTRAGGKPTVQFGLLALGCSKPIGEALIIKTSIAILEELGVEKTTVYLNSIGDRDSAARFARELTAHLRRNMHSLPPECQQAFKRSPFEALELLSESAASLLETLPRPLHFLSEVSRRHLREVLEFLELGAIPYVIEDRLMGHRECYSQTLFEIRARLPDGSEKTFVRGGRCDELARRHFKSALPIVGAAFEYRRGTGAVPQNFKARHAKFFLVQLGQSAKLLSLSVLETLRKARIPVHQSVVGDSLSQQLETARREKIPYLLIVGQREALDRTVIVRNMNSQAQAVVPLHGLPVYLKTSLKI